MIDLIDAEINKLFPIYGVGVNADGSYRIDYMEGTTEEQKLQANEIVDRIAIIEAKKAKLAQIDADFDSITKLGWDSGQGFSLGITAQDVSLLVGLFVLAKEASAMGLNPPPVIDMNGGIHALSMQELTALMLQYGQARALISAQDAMRRKAVENAITIEEVDNI